MVIPIRIIMFYVFALIVIMSVTLPVGSVVPDRDKSPFVELFVLVGLPAAAWRDPILCGADLCGVFR